MAATAKAAWGPEMAHKHEWKNTLYRRSPLTMGASGRGRTVAWKRVCVTCGLKQTRYTDYEKRRTLWRDDKDEK